MTDNNWEGKRMIHDKPLSSKEDKKNYIKIAVTEAGIGTQREIVDFLVKAGFQATQATVSRDIQELGLIKEAQPGGGFRYVMPPDPKIQKLMTLFSESVVKIDYSENFIVVHTLSGSANTAATLVDEMKEDSVMGTIAGDDTILIIIKDKQKTAEIAAKLKEIGTLAK